MADPLRPYMKQLSMIKSQIQDLVNEQRHLQLLIDDRRDLAVSFKTRWEIVKRYLDEILTGIYKYYSNGVPGLDQCEVHMEVKPRDVSEILSGEHNAVYKFFLIGPRETLGGKHRKRTNITNENYYLCAHPDPLFCSWLVENDLVEKLVETF